MKNIITLGIFTLLSLTTFALPVMAQVKKTCPVLGIKPLKQYVLKEEKRCFRSVRRAENAGFQAFNQRARARQRRRVRLAKSACNIMGVRANTIFFAPAQVRCFRSTARAENAGFLKLTIPTPTPTEAPAPQGTPEPTATPAPTPTVPLEPTVTPTATPPPFRVWSIALTEAEPGNGFSGECAVAMGGNRDTMTFACTHNVPAAHEAHMHIIPNNEALCILENPGSTFEYTCPITPAEADAIEAGNALYVIHAASGGENQACHGYIRD